jgi:hypothetical protein
MTRALRAPNRLTRREDCLEGALGAIAAEPNCPLSWPFMAMSSAHRSRLVSGTCGFLVWWSASACSPDLVVLSSASDAGDSGDTQSACTSASCGADSGACVKDIDCAPSWVCVSNVCVPCSAAISACDVKCDPALIPLAVDRNGCTVCTCGPPPECTNNTACKIGERCVGLKCYACGLVDDGCTIACPPGQTRYLTKRNGCPVCECAPTSECLKDSDCKDPGAVCLPGLSCEDSCGSTPSCCHGNRCAAPPCISLDKTPCTFSGCPYGLRCHSTCPAVSCTCSAAAPVWDCTSCSADYCSADP